jgi:hypothetical protein
MYVRNAMFLAIGAFAALVMKLRQKRPVIVQMPKRISAADPVAHLRRVGGL